MHLPRSTRVTLILAAVAVATASMVSCTHAPSAGVQTNLSRQEIQQKMALLHRHLPELQAQGILVDQFGPDGHKFMVVLDKETAKGSFGVVGQLVGIAGLELHGGASRPRLG